MRKMRANLTNVPLSDGDDRDAPEPLADVAEMRVQGAA